MPRFKKGFQEAKEYMTSMRAKREWRNKKNKDIEPEKVVNGNEDIEVREEEIIPDCENIPDFQEFYSQALKEFNETHGKNPISELEEISLKIKGLIDAVNYLLKK